MSFIDIKSLNLRMGNTPIIDDLTLSLQPNEIVAILGPSGCGKTSFLNILSGIIPPSGGDIVLNGKPIADRSRLCSYMFQDDLLFPWRSINQNVLLGVEVNDAANTAAKKTEAEYLLTLFGLKDFGNKYPHQLSGGMRRRAAFVRTLLNSERELFLFDEPTAGLDYLLRLQLEDKMFQFFSESKKTALLITHDIETAVALADRVLLFAPRPTTIIETYTVGLARKTGSTSAAREHADFQPIFQTILNAYANHGQ